MSANHEHLPLTIVKLLAEEVRIPIRGPHDQTGCTLVELHGICVAAVKWDREQGRIERRDPACATNNAVALLINSITDTAKEFHNHPSLRQRLAGIVLGAVRKGMKVT